MSTANPANPWSIVIQALGTVATILVAILAIWGEYVRSRFAGPRLSLTLHDPEGEAIARSSGEMTRYYHLKVSNRRRWAPARNVRVVLTSIIKPAADGTLPARRLSGPLQLTWQFPQIHPQYPTIGPDDICDLGCLVRGKGFELTPYVIPNNFEGHLDQPGRMLVEVQAVADNAESKSLTIEVAWDGKWSDDTAEMRRHLVVKAANSVV